MSDLEYRSIHLIHTGSLTAYPLKVRRSQGAYTPCYLFFDEAPSSALKKGLLSLRLLAGFPGLETYLLLAACPVLLLVRARGGSLSVCVKASETFCGSRCRRPTRKKSHGH